MLFLKRKGLRKFFVISSVLLLFVVLIAPSGLEASRGDCMRAYFKCGINAALLSIANPALGAAWAAACVIGYVWCLEFFG
jgi:hypothetical protein